jgi:PKD repeat protein
LTFSAEGASGEEPVLAYHWDFGDGLAQDGMQVHHAYTQSGKYTVQVTGAGLEATTNSKTITVTISGNISTKFVPADKKRPE